MNERRNVWFSRVYIIQKNRMEEKIIQFLGETAPTTDDSLAALGVTYQEEVKTLDAIMDACKRRLQRAQHLQDHTEIYRLQRLLRLHGEQRDDLLDIAYNLIHYYQENVPPARTV